MKPLQYLLGCTLLQACSASAQQLPPVYLNHLPMYFDQATLDDLTDSAFLKDEFSAFAKATTQANGGKWTYTGVYAIGSATYFEFFPGGVMGLPGEPLFPTGHVTFGLWIDNREQLPLICDSLNKNTKGVCEIEVEKDGKDLKWYDAARAKYPPNPSVRTLPFVMALYGGEDLKKRFPDLKPDEAGTTREQSLKRVYAPDKLFRGITGVRLTVNSLERERLSREFQAFGYNVRNEGNQTLASGHDFGLVMVPAGADGSRHIAVSMKLNRAKDGPQTVQIGKTSEMRFDGDSAVWYFPKYW
jgi:Family of unknown function (DUF5829)